MSIASEITRLQGVKSDILTAIGNKGVTVPADAMLDDCPTLIGQIETGGGDDSSLKALIDRSLTSVEIPSGTTEIGEYAFRGCSSLATCTMPSTVTSIGSYGFWGCQILPSIDLTNVVTISDHAFGACYALTSATMPAVTSIGASTFFRCYYLAYVDIGSGCDSLPAYMFQYCSRLETLILRNTTPLSLGSYVFSGATLVTNGTAKIYVPYGYGNTYKTATDWSAYASQIYELDSNGNIPS